jgi:hypothetical protein
MVNQIVVWPTYAVVVGNLGALVFFVLHFLPVLHFVCCLSSSMYEYCSFKWIYPVITWLLVSFPGSGNPVFFISFSSCSNVQQYCYVLHIAVYTLQISLSGLWNFIKRKLHGSNFVCSSISTCWDSSNYLYFASKENLALS